MKVEPRASLNSLRVPIEASRDANARQKKGDVKVRAYVGAVNYLLK